MKNQIRFILSLLSILAATSVFAVRVNSIYQASIPVASQSAEDRLKAQQQALAQVFAKVSGESHVIENPDIKSILESPEKYIRQFTYSPSPSTPSMPYVLQVQFDKEEINRVLLDVGTPVWGQNRPLILAWVEYEMPDKPAVIIDSDSKSDIQELFKQHSEQRGLPLILPMMDMSDLDKVNVNDIVTMSLPALEMASNRYASDAILIVRIFKVQQGFSIQSKMVMKGDEWEWTVEGQTLEQVIADLFGNVSETLAGRYASLRSNAAQAQLALQSTKVAQKGVGPQHINGILKL